MNRITNANINTCSVEQVYLLSFWKGKYKYKQRTGSYYQERGSTQYEWNPIGGGRSFWSIVLCDHWSKKIYRPKMIVWWLVLYSSQMILFIICVIWDSLFLIWVMFQKNVPTGLFVLQLCLLDWVHLHSVIKIVSFHWRNIPNLIIKWTSSSLMESIRFNSCQLQTVTKCDNFSPVFFELSEAFPRLT